MTAIAYRDGVLAADTACFQGDIIGGHDKKIYRLSDGRLYAGAGRCWQIETVAAWLETQPPSELIFDEDPPNGILVSADGSQVWCLQGKNQTPWKAPKAEFHAAGAACEFLSGALAAGAGAEEAVRLAIQYHCFAGGEVVVERIAGQAPS